MEPLDFGEDDPGRVKVKMGGVVFEVDVFDAALRFDALAYDPECEEDNVVRWGKAQDIIIKLGGPAVSKAKAMEFFSKVIKLGNDLKKNWEPDADGQPESPTSSPEPATPS